MFKYLIAAASLLLLAAPGFPAHSSDIKASKPSASAASTAARASSNPGSVAFPPEIKFPASVGEVLFHHGMHIKDLGIKCAECHHQINAKKLHTPHPDYLKSSWINCKICHNGSAKAGQQLYTCSACHQDNPTNIADETLSAKVVIHKQCWKCHAVGTGRDASQGCDKCHSKKKTS